MAVTEIIGPRIKPLWADPVEWTSTRTYEPFTFVTYQGDSYCSRQDTPVGIEITNGDYWVKVSDYNAQAVALQRSVASTIETAEANMENTIQTAEDNMAEQVNAVESVKNEFQTQLDQVTTNKNNIATLTDYINGNDVYLIMGDSWSEYDPDASATILPYITWVNRMCDAFPNKIYSFGIGSTNTSQFSQQLVNASNSNKFDNRQVKKILVVGGVNDIGANYDSDTSLSNMDSFCDTAKQLFPNASVIWAHNCYSPLSSNYNYGVSLDTSAIRYASKKYTFVPLSKYLVCPAFFSNDENNSYVGDYHIAGLHLNLTGCVVMENIARYALFGANPVFYRSNIFGQNTLGCDIKILKADGSVVTTFPSDTNVKLEISADGLQFDIGHEQSNISLASFETNGFIIGADPNYAANCMLPCGYYYSDQCHSSMVTNNAVSYIVARQWDVNPIATYGNTTVSVFGSYWCYPLDESKTVTIAIRM